MRASATSSRAQMTGSPRASTESLSRASSGSPSPTRIPGARRAPTTISTTAVRGSHHVDADGRGDMRRHISGGSGGGGDPRRPGGQGHSMAMQAVPTGRAMQAVDTGMGMVAVPTRRIMQAVPTEKFHMAKWRRGNSNLSGLRAETDGQSCTYCKLKLPCAEGYVACCRTCKVSGGMSHGPSCLAYRPPAQEFGERDDDLASIYSDDQVSLPDKEDMTKWAKHHQMASACTVSSDKHGTFERLPLWSTPRKQLGQFGSGVRLYFEFLLWMGTTFGVIQLVCLPMLAMILSGSFGQTVVENDSLMAIGNVQKTLVYLTLGNLGYCGPDNHCQTRESRENRLFSASGPWSDKKLRDMTLWYALNDCLAVVLFSLSLFVFRKWRVEQVTEEVDEDNITATDYAFRVGHLPEALGLRPGATLQDKRIALKGARHAHYEVLLKEHFQELIKSLFADEVEEGVDPDVAFVDCVVEVVLVREWNGAFSRFHVQGDCLLEKENIKKKLALCRSKLQQCSAEVRASLKKKEANLKNLLKQKVHKIYALEDELQRQAVPTEQREVLGAFVIVNEERFKDKLIKKYRPHNSSLTNWTLGERWMFEGHRITVQKCSEPLDVLWENMDYSSTTSRTARISTGIITIAMVLAVMVGNMILRSVPLQYPMDPPDNMVWSLYNDKDCWELSDLKVYSDILCTQEITNYECVDSDGAGLSTVACNKTLATFQSASCPGANGMDHGVALKFSAETAVGCIMATLGPATTADSIRFESCDATFEGANLKSSEWQVSPNCSLLRPLMLPEGRYDAQGERIRGTGGETMIAKRAADLETSCGSFADKSVADMEQVKQLIIERAPEEEREEQLAFAPRLACYCEGQRKSKGPDWPWRTTNAGPEGGDPEHQVCYEWLIVYRAKIWKSVVSGVLVAFANQILKAIFRQIDKVNLYKSRTAQRTGSIVNLCFTQVLVAGFMMLITSQNFNDTLDNTGEVLRPRGQYFDDFFAGWYLSVASSYYPVLVGQASSVLIITLGWKFVLGPLLRKFKQRNKYVQVMLDEAYELPEWNISGRFSESLTIIFCTMLFSSMMPAVYLIGTCYCFAAYWIDKYKLLTDVVRPPDYDNRMVKFAIKVCRLAVLTHLGIAMWAFGSQDVLPSDWGPSWAKDFIEDYVTGISASEYDEIMLVYQVSDQHEKYQIARFNDLARMGCLPMVALFIPLFVYYSKTLVNTFFRPCMKSCYAAVAMVRHHSMKKATKVVKNVPKHDAVKKVGKIVKNANVLSVKRSDATGETFLEVINFDDSVKSADSSRQLEKARKVGGGEDIWVRSPAGVTNSHSKDFLDNGTKSFGTKSTTSRIPTTKGGQLMSYHIKFHPKYMRAYEALCIAGAESGAHSRQNSRGTQASSPSRGSRSPNGSSLSIPVPNGSSRSIPV